jgi:hypothetical protein
VLYRSATKVLGENWVSFLTRRIVLRKMLTNEVVGKEVIGLDGFKLGEISDTEFDEKTWKLNSLEVHLEKDVAEEHHLRHRLRKTKF